MNLEVTDDEAEYIYLAVYGEIQQLSRALKGDPGLGKRMEDRIAGLESILKKLKLIMKKKVNKMNISKEAYISEISSRCEGIFDSMEDVKTKMRRSLKPRVAKDGKSWNTRMVDDIISHLNSFFKIMESKIESLQIIKNNSLGYVEKL